MHKCGQRGQRSPGDHSCANHPTCAPMFDQYGPGDLQGHIADEEYADRHAKDLIVESQVARHSKSGVCHASAIEIVDDVKNEEKWKQPKCDMAPGVVGRRSRNSPGAMRE